MGTFAVAGARANDWEALAVGPKVGARGAFIYVGDIGDNASLFGGSGRARDVITVYRVAEPARRPAAPGRALSGTEKIELVYPGDTEDAEAMLVDPVSGDLVIITKSPFGRSRILVAPATTLADGARVTLRDRGTMQITPDLDGTGRFPGTFVTGADISPDGSLILVRTYQAVLAFTRSKSQAVPEALRGKSCDAPQREEEQGESIALAADSSRYLTVSEGRTPAVHVFAVKGKSATPTSSGAQPSPPPRREPAGVDARVAAAFAGISLLAIVLVRRRLTRGRDGEI